MSSIRKPDQKSASPIPPRTVRLPFVPKPHPGWKSRLPFETLAPGDAFVVDARRADERSVRQAVLRYRRKIPDRVFSVETEADAPFGHVVRRIE